MMKLGTLATIALIVAACGGETAPATPSASPIDLTSTTINYPQEVAAVPEDRPVYQGFNTETVPDSMTIVVRALAPVDVYEEPEGIEPFTTLDPTTILGTPTVLAVVDGPSDGWAEVMLPIRPNGSTGWVRTSEMSLYVVEGRVIVDLSERTLTYFEKDTVILESAVAIGTDRNPTPTGSFFVTDNVTLANPNSPWGPHAFGLSARSDTITEYNGGDGIIGIHGTNRPSSIGASASLGCIRLPNDVIAQLHESIPVGTPVEIVA